MRLAACTFASASPLVDEPDVIRAFQLYRTADDAATFLRTPEYLEHADVVGERLDGPPHVASAPAAWVKP